MKLASYILILAYSLPLFAMECPTPSENYKTLLSRLETFSVEINRNTECQGLSQEFRDLQLIYSKSNRDLVKNTLNSKMKKEISVEQLNAISSYSENVTGKIGSIVEKIRNNPKCTDEQQTTSILKTVADITKEVTSVAGAFTGPYGIAINVGGTVVAGILRGIDAIIEKRGKGYSFKKAADRQLYVSNLCTYHDIRREINDIISPESSMNTLETLIRELKVKEGKLVRSYPLATEYNELYKIQQSVKKRMDGLNEQISVIEKNLSTVTPWESCVAISRLIRPSSSLIRSIVKDIPNDNITSLELMAISNEGVLSEEKCWQGTSVEELTPANLKGLSFVRAIRDDIQKFFSTGLASIVEQGGDFTDPNVMNYPYYLKINYEKLDWAAEEILKLKGMNGNGSYTVRREINENKEFLDNRIFHQLAPQFLNWYRKDAARSVRKVERRVKSLGKVLSQYSSHRRVYFRSNERIIDMLSSLQKRGNDVDHALVYNEIDQTVTMLKNVAFSLNAVGEYCNYFSMAGTKNGKIVKMCTDGKLVQKRRQFSEYGKLLTAFSDYLDWCHQHQKIEANWIKALIQKIKLCHKKL